MPGPDRDKLVATLRDLRDMHLMDPETYSRTYEEELLARVAAILDPPSHGLTVEQIDRCFSLCSCKEDSDGPCAVCDYLIGVRKDALDRQAPAPLTAGQFAAFEDGTNRSDAEPTPEEYAAHAEYLTRAKRLNDRNKAASPSPPPDLAALAAIVRKLMRRHSLLALDNQPWTEIEEIEARLFTSAPQLADALERAAGREQRIADFENAWESMRLSILHESNGDQGLDSDQINHVLGIVDGYYPEPPAPTQPGAAGANAGRES